MGPVGQKCPTGPAFKRAAVPSRTKLCRITGLDSEPPTIQKIAKTNPQVDSLPFSKNEGMDEGPDISPVIRHTFEMAPYP